jgi:hypothetical protein
LRLHGLEPVLQLPDACRRLLLLLLLLQIALQQAPLQLKLPLFAPSSESCATLVARLLSRRPRRPSSRRIAVRHAASRCLYSLLTSLPLMMNLVRMVHEVHHDAVLLERVSAGSPESGREARDVAHLASAQASGESRTTARR